MFCESQLKVFLFIKIFFELLSTVVSNRMNFETFNIEENPIYISDVEIILHPKFPSNVHELMTPDEILDTFGTNGSVPEYHVFPMKFSKGRNKRQIDNEININMDVKGTIINLNLKPTDGLLASRYTPVWQAYTDSKAYKHIRYDYFQNAMTDIGEFKMYQDLKNEAAIVIYRDHNNYAILEGVVTPKYVVKTLPERFSKISIKKNYNNFVNISMRQKRSIEDDEDVITGHYVLVKVEPSSENTRSHSHLKLKRRIKRRTLSRREVTKTIYPEILLVIDHNVIRRQSLTQALRFMLAFWNAVDMIYSSLEEPKIRLNIAGIIISADDTATPYIANNTSIKYKNHASSILIEMGEYFYQEIERFPIRYDIIIGMTTMQLCSGQLDPCSKDVGMAYTDSSCMPFGYTKISKSIASIGVFTYGPTYVGIEVAAHETAHIIGVEHDDDNCKGFLMMPSFDKLEYHFKWSPCSKSAFTRVFGKNNLRCMENKPAGTKAITMTSIGYWLTLDGQCRNIGFRKACKQPGISPCEIQGCQNKDSDECIQSELLCLVPNMTRISNNFQIRE